MRLSLLVATLLCSLLLTTTTGCPAPQVCNGPISEFTIDPNNSPCSQDCECNNLEFTGGCVKNKCSSVQRESCKKKGEIRSCQLPPYAISNQCSQGVQECAPDSLKSEKWGDCTPFTPDKNEKDVKRCFDGLDNDCDGKIDGFDEDCKDFCIPNKNEPCYTGPPSTKNIGNCATGTRTCKADGTWDTCKSEVLPSKEICNGQDNNCNGKIDDVDGGCICKVIGQKEPCYAGTKESQNKGPCKPGIRTCQTNLLWGACLGQILPSSEECNGQDDDCNGKTDDGINCSCSTPNQSQACYTGPDGTLNKGVCSGGTRVCQSNGSWGGCIGQVLPTPEVCDGKDNDCDGEVDEGCANRPCESDNDCAKEFLCRAKRCQAKEICDPPCSGLKRCEAGTCSCPENWLDCKGVCANSKTDNQNCGGCEKACKTGESCVEGVCKLLCPAGQKACSGQCIATQRDFLHCGDCDQACKLGQACVAGKCECPGGQSLCTDKCVDFQLNPLHCGSCNKACASGERCEKGLCILCRPNETRCGTNCCVSPHACCNNACLDTRFDNQNCGACGTTCKAGELCCGGSCKDFLSDNQNCGGCGRVCATGQACCNGQCTDTKASPLHCGACGKSCIVGQLCCSGTCADPQSDSNHCSACGKSCTTGLGCCGAQCLSYQNNDLHCGACNKACLPGRKCCGSSCADFDNDLNNCGSCGNKCGVGETCCAGVCANLSTENSHCGRCGNSCYQGETCSGYKCSKGCTVASDCPSSYYFDCVGGSCVGLTPPKTGLPSETGVGFSAEYTYRYFVVNHTSAYTLGTINLPHAGGDDSFLVRYNNSNKTFDQLLLHLTAAGNQTTRSYHGYASISYLVGTFDTSFTSGTKSFTGPAASRQNMFVLNRINYSTSPPTWGIQTYAKTTGKIYPEKINSSSLGTVVVGSFTGEHGTSLTLPSEFKANSGIEDAFVLLLNRGNGTTQWGVSLGSTKFAKALSLWSDGRTLFVGGIFEGTLGQGTQKVTSSAAGGNDIFVAQLDPSNGKILWIRAIGGDKADTLTKIQIDSAGNIFIAGQISPNAKYGTRSLPIQSPTGEAFVLKLSNTGSFQWFRSIPTLQNDSIVKDLLLYDGKIAIVGNTKGDLAFGNNPAKKLGVQDGFIAQIDGKGNILWIKIAGGAGATVDVIAIQETNTSYVFFGNYTGTITFEKQSITSNNQDFFTFSTYSSEPPPSQGGE